MKRNEYINAVDKLEFSGDLAIRVRGAEKRTPGFRMVRVAALAAVLACFMITSAFGAIAVLRERPVRVEALGKDAQELTEAKHMSFTISQGNEGIEKHYMQLHPSHSYHFRHGLLWDRQGDFLRITQDYRLETVEMNEVHLTIEKNNRTYYLDFTYLDAENGVLSNHRSVYYKNDQGEILLDATDGSSNQWPVYFNPETGTIRDALPEWTAADFEGRFGGAYQLMDGLLITTIANEGLPNAANMLYWIASGSREARIIRLPGNGLWTVENGTIYYQNDSGQLYAMDEKFAFRLICEYETMDYLQDGLLTVSVRGKLGIVDAYTGELFVFEEMEASRTDTRNYHAIRYGSQGTIALVHTEWAHEPDRIALRGLGLVDRETSQLKLLQIENDYDGGQCNWLDANRLAVAYQSDLGQYLCVYEFEE